MFIHCAPFMLSARAAVQPRSNSADLMCMADQLGVPCPALTKKRGRGKVHVR